MTRRNTEAVPSDLLELHDAIVNCRKCRRLVSWRERIAREKVARFRDCSYWGRPVPGFGDPDARLLVIGLAPAAHGGNRTGRMFTGDRSGDWLYRALHRFGFANQPTSVSRDDGLQLKNCYITASLRCAPPQNRPSPKELDNCRPFLPAELRLLTNVSVVVALGRLAYDVAFNVLSELKVIATKSKPLFRHGVCVLLSERLTLIGSYHPSQRNTFTGMLTESMFDRIFRQARALLQ